MRVLVTGASGGLVPFVMRALWERHEVVLMSKRGSDLCAHPVANISLLWAHKGTTPDPGTLVKIALRGPDPKEVRIWTHHENQIQRLASDVARRRHGRPIP
jgi:hypothetical protein